MVYQIYIGEERPYWTLFDIEYYPMQSRQKDKKGLWRSEIKVTPVVEGLWRFFKSVKDDNNFNHEEFLKDAEEISDLRNWLYEVDGNRFSETTILHYGKRREYIKNKIYSFAKKYRLYINVD